MVKRKDMPLFDKHGFTDAGLFAYGQLRSQDKTREEAEEILITSDKLRRTARSGIFGR